MIFCSKASKMQNETKMVSEETGRKLDLILIKTDLFSGLSQGLVPQLFVHVSFALMQKVDLFALEQIG